MQTTLRKTALVSAAIAVVTFLVTLLLVGVDQQEAIQAAARGGASFTVVGLFWAFYNRIGWRLPPFRIFGWLCNLPDLNGRWEGTVCRDSNDTPHPFVLEVRQTFTTISFRTFSAHSSGRSDHAFITVDESGELFGVIAVWRTTTNRLDDPALRETFSGTSIWAIQLDDQPGDLSDRMKIVDTYYTTRTPRTSGVIEVRRVSKDLRNAFS